MMSKKILTCFLKEIIITFLHLQQVYVLPERKKKTLENMRNFSNSTLLPETYTRSVAHGRVEEEVSRKSLLKILKLLVKTP